MVQHITSAPEQIAFVQSTSAQNYAGNHNGVEEGQGGGKPFRLFGEDGLTFWDLIDVINPLQHIPVVSTFYRRITGDEIDPGARVFGGAIFGGPIGAGVQVVNAFIEHQTGKDFGEHAVALFSDDAPVNAPNQSLPEEVAGVAPGNFAAAGPSNPVVSGFAGPSSAPPPFQADQFNAAGMSAIPMAKNNFAFEDRAAAYRPAATPDLGLLGATAKPNVFSRPLQLTPRFPVNEEAPVAAMRNITEVERDLAEAKNSWVVESMMRGLDKYHAGKRLGGASENRQVSILR